MSLPGQWPDFSQLPEGLTLSGMPLTGTFVVGLAILLVVFYPSRSLYNYLASKLFARASRPMATPSAQPESRALAQASQTRSQSGLPNCGFGDVRVSKILIHPIKSCRGTSVQSSRYSPEGLENDRKWCIIDAQTADVITAREVAKMVLITPRIVPDEGSPYGGFLRVSFPDDSGCEEFAVPLSPTAEVLASWKSLEKVMMWGNAIHGHICESLPSSSSPSPSQSQSPSAILSRYFDKPVHLVFKGSRPRPCDPTPVFPDLKATAVFQDGYPLLVASEESLLAVETELRGHVGKQGVDERWKSDRLVIERFRPNIVCEGGGPFAEDMWTEIGIGSDAEALSSAPGILVVSKCARCLLPNAAPETGVRDKAVPYKVLMKFRTNIDPENKWKPCFGCNGVPLGYGEIRVGDQVGVRKIV